MNFAKIIWVIFDLMCICFFWCLNVTSFCMPCHVLLMKWIWLMILMWDFLRFVPGWMNMIHVKFQVLFWMFDPLLTLGFDLVVWTHCLDCGFQVRCTLPWLEWLIHLSLIIGCCLLTLVCFVGWCQFICVCLVPCSLLSDDALSVCLLLTVDCLSVQLN